MATQPPTDTEARTSSFDDPAGEDIDVGHPRGTLAIVVTFAVLFALAWLAMYVFLFLERGAPHA